MRCFAQEMACGRIPTPGLAARLHARLAPVCGVGSSGGQDRAGATRKGSEVRGSFCQPDVARAPRRRWRGAAQLRRRAERGRRPARDEWGLLRCRATPLSAGGCSAPSAMWPPDSGASRRRCRPSTVGTTGRLSPRGGCRTCCRRRCDPSTAGPGHGDTRRSPCNPRGCGPRAGPPARRRSSWHCDHVDGGRPSVRRGGRRPQAGGGRGDEEDHLGTAREQGNSTMRRV